MSAFSTPVERFLRDIIAIPSVTGSEGLMKGYLENAFENMGLDVVTQHVDDDRYNVIGRTSDGPIKLMLCTHMDVIPALDVSMWKTPPFEAVFKDGRIYGRGSTDAKGQLAAMMAAIERAKDVPGIALAAVVEEETGRSLGARKVLEKYVPKMCVIGEPTGMRMAIAHKGGVRARITVHGKASHSSSPERGVNAINIACEAIRDVNEYREIVMRKKDPLLGNSSLEVTMVRGGERINVTPQRCDIFTDRRLVLDETIEGAYDGLEKAVASVSKRTGAKIDVKLLCAYPTTRVDPNEKIVLITQQALEQNELSSTPIGFPAGCDMWAFSVKNIPAIVLGCGGVAQAHVIDEYVETGSLNKLVDVHEAVIRLTS